MTGQVGGFQNPGVCLQAFPSFLPHPSWLFYLHHFSSLTLAPLSLFLNRTETLATQANCDVKIFVNEKNEMVVEVINYDD